MSWTKRQFVNQAFEEVGLASYVFDLTPDQMNSAMRRMDSMLASWNAKGIRLGYPIPANPQDSDLDTETNVPDEANEAIYTNLALRIAPSFGKPVANDLKANAKATYDVLLMKAAMPQEQQLPGTLPSGAGNKRSDPFISDPDTNPLNVGGNGQLIFLGN